MVFVGARNRYEVDPDNIDYPPRLQKRLKRKARLSTHEREKYIRQNTTKQCDITGDHIGKKGHVHHLRPVYAYGDKNLENLSYVDSDLHTAIHSQASQRAKHTGRAVYEEVEYLTRSALELGKLGRVEAGESPGKVYKREAKIAKMQQLKSEQLEP